MAFFMLTALDDLPDSVKKREAVRPKHLAYMRTIAGPIVVAGPLFDADGKQSGSFYVMEADSEQAVHEMFKNEPFRQAGVYKDFIVRRLELAFSRLPQQDWAKPKS
jgi:uncharacterized protein YciI